MQRSHGLLHLRTDRGAVRTRIGGDVARRRTRSIREPVNESVLVCAAATAAASLNTRSRCQLPHLLSKVTRGAILDRPVFPEKSLGDPLGPVCMRGSATYHRTCVLLFVARGATQTPPRQDVVNRLWPDVRWPPFSSAAGAIRHFRGASRPVRGWRLDPSSLARRRMACLGPPRRSEVCPLPALRRDGGGRPGRHAPAPRAPCEGLGGRPGRFATSLSGARDRRNRACRTRTPDGPVHAPRGPMCGTRRAVLGARRPSRTASRSPRAAAHAGRGSLRRRRSWPRCSAPRGNASAPPSE